MHYEKQVICINCGKKFNRKNIGVKWCSEECRLLSKIEKKENGCWEWQRFKTYQGYGWSAIKEKTMSAHRHSYIIFKGEIPEDKFVCHKCDNPGCINPDHLFLGTQKENMLDKSRKKRCQNTKGSLHPLSRFNENDIVKMKKLYKKGLSQTKIAKIYKCDQSHISRIMANKSWSHV